MKLENIIGKVIRSARMNKKITQTDLAKQINISRSYLSDIECGRYTPSVNKLIKIFIFLELDLNLIKNDGNTSVKGGGGKNNEGIRN